MSTTFTRTRPGTLDPTNSTWANPPAVVSIPGVALQVRGDAQRYAALGLTLATMPTLFFTPDDYELEAFSDDFVLPGDRVTWNSTTYTVKDVAPIAPDGVVIAARIIVGT